MELETSVAWRAVSVDDFNPGLGATWCRGRGWFAWQLAGEHVGVRCERVPGNVDEAALVSSVGLSLARFGDCDLMLDAGQTQLAGWPTELTSIEHLLSRLARALGPRVRRSVVVAAALGPWWRGVLSAAEPAFPWQVVANRSDAWRWLETPRAEAAVERLLDNDQSTLVAQLESVVRAAPGADLPTIARALGMSVRSLQRTLNDRDTSFNVVRDRVRLALARHHLTDATYKIEAVAREIGFASTGHFCQWFRKHTGVSPGASRKRHPTC